ncbi:hypothetical protein QBC32DRAFT_331997 [Pseudoneurospora amorphoporcata]|uniref:Uncharacterized protein n=1 Tax=Pseudoneurospora amorphoporcata TaxID=241081 RepID=A0AAN6SK92_9PEZI|nr:hypothetical protein QBC32DRAFT_331997 [Pseudoneurospora amorphoporcata]
MARMAPNPTSVEPMTSKNDTTIPESPSSLPQTPHNTKSSWVTGKRNKLLRHIPLFKPPKTETPTMASTSSRPADNQHVEADYSSTQREEAARSVSPDSALVGIGHDGDQDRGEGSQSPPSNSQYQYQSVPSPPLNPEQPQSPNEANIGIYPTYPATFPGGFHSYSPPPMAMYPGSPIAPQVINFQGWGQAYDAQSLMSSPQTPFTPFGQPPFGQPVYGQTGYGEPPYGQPPFECAARSGPYREKISWLGTTLWFLSIFSTIGSGLWLGVAFIQPKWGKTVSSAQGALPPSTASLLTALIAKLIETSFVAVFVASVGQILTKKAFDVGNRGVTLGEFGMKNWVVSPGLMFTNIKAWKKVGFTPLGILCMAATLVAVLYTTASDALVAPKLKWGKPELIVMKNYAMSGYGNVSFVKRSCQLPDTLLADEHSPDSCLAASLSGFSYHNFQAFLSTWSEFGRNNTKPEGRYMSNRPPVTATLYDNVTVTGTWINTEYSDPMTRYEQYKRVVNNVTLAVPHPGVYDAATDPTNEILQPSDLSGVGEYRLAASAVSPALNVLCVEMTGKELAPLVYTAWPRANLTNAELKGEVTGGLNWLNDVPRYDWAPNETQWLNRTDVDDIFRWGPDYHRRPPVFQRYPSEYNVIINATVQGSTNWTYKSGSVYTLVNNNFTPDYTLCEIRSWLSINCSTHLNISGTTGAHMSANCEDESDPVSYRKSVPDAVESDEADWKWLADAWQLAIYMNSGLTTLNASRDRILTALPLEDHFLPLKTPSLAEVLAALVSPTLISGSIKTPLVNYWPPEAINASLPGMPGWKHEFNASITKQEYTSGSAQEWQRAFLLILIMGFLLNLFCLVHLFIQLRGRPLTDFTDPANLFALAMNSPPSYQLSGTCGGGPKGTQLDVPWRIGYSEQSNHYFFEEATEKRQRLKRKSRRDMVTSEMELVDFKDGDTKGKTDDPRQSYIKLSNHKSWL